MCVALGSLLLAACTNVGIGVANLPNKFSDTRTIKNLAYGSKPWQKLDLYIPANSASAPLPVIVFFYGGSWKDGSKSIYPFIGEAFAKKGYITVIADYSKYPQVKFPTFVEDAAKAVAWTYKNIDQYHGNSDALFVSGHSAGGHIGSLVVADERYLAAEGESPSIIKGFVGLAGAYDFEPDEPDYIDMFGPPENYPNMQATTFIDGKEPPMLLLWGADDETVGKRNMDRLMAKIQAENGIVESKVYDSVNHKGIITEFVWFLKSKAPIMDDITDFLDRYQ
jgi:acetyl esterase/lipase